MSYAGTTHRARLNVPYQMPNGKWVHHRVCTGDGCDKIVKATSDYEVLHSEAMCVPCRKKRSVIEKVCLYCEQDFSVTWKDRSKQFCDKSCSGKWVGREKIRKSQERENAQWQWVGDLADEVNANDALESIVSVPKPTGDDLLASAYEEHCRRARDAAWDMGMHADTSTHQPSDLELWGALWLIHGYPGETIAGTVRRMLGIDVPVWRDMPRTPSKACEVCGVFTQPRGGKYVHRKCGNV